MGTKVIKCLLTLWDNPCLYENCEFILVHNFVGNDSDSTFVGAFVLEFYLLDSHMRSVRFVFAIFVVFFSNHLIGTNFVDENLFPLVGRAIRYEIDIDLLFDLLLGVEASEGRIVADNLLVRLFLKGFIK